MKKRRTLEEDEVVGVAVVLFKGEPGGIVVLYLAYGGGELCPGVLDRGVGADLGGQCMAWIYRRTFLGGRCGGGVSGDVHA